MAISFGVNLTGNVKTEAGSAAHQVSVLSAQMRSLQSAMIKANAVGDAGKFNKAADAYNKLNKAVSDLGVTHLPAASKAAGHAAGSAGGLGDALLAANVEAKALEVAAGLAKSAVEGLASALEAGAMAAIHEADKTRQLTATFNALTGNGKGVTDMLDNLATQLPFADDEMAKWAKTMAAAGTRDLPSLERGIRAAASATAIMGEGAAEHLSSMVARLKAGEMTGKGLKDLGKAFLGVGVSVDEVASAMGVTTKQLSAMSKAGQGLDKIGAAIETALIRKGGPALAAFGSSWERMTSIAKDRVSKLFEGVGDTPGFKAFVASLQTVLNLLSGTSNVGAAAKAGITSSFGAMFGVVAKFITMATVGALNLATAMVRLYIASWPTLHRIHEMWKAANGAKQVRVVWQGLVTVAQVLAKGVMNLARPFVYMAGALVGIVTAGLWVIGRIGKVAGRIIDTLLTPFKKIREWFANIGGKIIDGLIDGLKGRDKDIGAQMKALTDKVKNAATGNLEVHSPSRVFMRIGENVSEGMALGISSKAADVESSSSRMSDGAVSGASGKAARGGGMTVRIERGAIVIHGAGGNILDLTEEALVSILGRIAESQGLATSTP